MAPPRILIVIPVYNEAGTLPQLVAELRQPPLPGCDLLFIEDNSPDGSRAVIRQLQERDPHLHCLPRERKLGLGSAYTDGFRYALAHGYEVVIQMDADLSHPPHEIPRLLTALDHADLVLGSKYVDGIRVQDWPLRRLLFSLAANRFIRLLTGMPYCDCTCGFKCFRATTLALIALDGVPERGYAFQVDLLYRVFCRRLRIVEVPITFYARRSGYSKVTPRVILEAFFSLFRICRRNRRFPAPPR